MQKFLRQVVNIHQKDKIVLLCKDPVRNPVNYKLNNKGTTSFIMR